MSNKIHTPNSNDLSCGVKVERFGSHIFASYEGQRKCVKFNTPTEAKYRLQAAVDAYEQYEDQPEVRVRALFEGLYGCKVIK